MTRKTGPHPREQLPPGQPNPSVEETMADELDMEKEVV